MEDNKITNVKVEENEVALDTIEENDSEDAGLGVAIAGVVLGVGALTALIYKNRDKIKAKIIARQIAKLEKDGYIVSKLVECEVVENDEDETKE